MARALSMDLRERAVARLAAGESVRTVAAALSVAPSSVVKWSQRLRATGSVAPGQLGGHVPPKISGPQRAWLVERIAAEAFTLRGLVAELAERGVGVDYRTVWKCVRREGLSFKKKLGRQSWLEQSLLEPGEEGIRILPETVAHDPRAAAALEAGPQLHPPLPVGGGELACGDRARSRDHAGDEPDGAAEHQRRRGCLAARGAALVVAVRPEQLLQPVVGARQAFDPIAVEQAGSVAGGDLHEVVDRHGQRTGFVASPSPGLQETLVAGLHPGRVEPGPVREGEGGRVEPAVGPTDVGPQSGRALQTTPDEGRDPPQGLAQSPLSSTRPRLPAIASSRACSRSPEAASGGRPSSVSAERTAAQ